MYAWMRCIASASCAGPPVKRSPAVPRTSSPLDGKNMLRLSRPSADEKASTCASAASTGSFCSCSSSRWVVLGPSPVAPGLMNV